MRHTPPVFTTTAEEEPTPWFPEGKAIAFICISTLIVAFGPLFKIWPILILYALWLPHIVHQNRLTLKPTTAGTVLWFLGGLSLVSTLWSNAPATSLYNSILFLSMLTCLSIISQTVRFETFIKALTISLFLTLLITLLSGNYMDIYATGEHALKGYFGNKNVVGYFASAGLIGAFSLLLSKDTWKLKAFYASALILTLISLLMSHSTTSIISSTLMLAGCSAIIILGRFPPGLRILVFSLCILSGIGLIVFIVGSELPVFSKILEFFGKEPTLTGRTWLWSEGLQRAAERPLGGYGYRAFWLPENPDAQLLWHQSHFEKTQGFHFHNLYLESQIELGIFGTITMAFLMLSTFVRSLYLALTKKLSPEIIFSLGIAIMFTLRSITEVDIIGPFGLGPYLFFTTYLKIWKKQPLKIAEPEKLRKNH
ncbi:MAG: O-antigen ligase family protein [Alphaproteobacteria bacterium]|nr:O-antigen ligase family protein [Alphaproteobacteria bacterium]